MQLRLVFMQVGEYIGQIESGFRQVRIFSNFLKERYEKDTWRRSTIPMAKRLKLHRNDYAKNALTFLEPFTK
jgi:hypothetical protein